MHVVIRVNIYSFIGIQDRSISSTEPKRLLGISSRIHCRMPQSTGLIFPRRGLCTYRGLSSTLYRSSGFQTFRSHDPLTYPIPDSRWAQFLRANPLMTIPWSIWPCSQDRGHLFSYRDFVLNFPDGFFSSLAPSLCAWSIWPASVTVALYRPIGIRGFGVCDVNERTSLGFPIPWSPMPPVVNSRRGWTLRHLSSLKCYGFGTCRILGFCYFFGCDSFICGKP